VQLNEIPSVASTEDEKKYFDDSIRVFKNSVLIYLSSVPNFEINIKAAYTRSITVQKRRDLIALMKLHEKLLISIKNRTSLC